MRQWITLIESATQHVEKSFYLHVTKAENYESIKANGLVPNHNGGNYDDSRWISLDGVYASRHAEQLHDYLNNHEIMNYLIIVIEVDMTSALPDEDLIDITFDYILEAMLRADGITLYGPEFEEMYPGEEPFEHYVNSLTQAFHTQAAGKFHVDIDENLIRDAAEIWLCMKVGLDEGDGAMMWGDIKDKIVRAYPKMLHPELGVQHSIRIPNKVGFTGDTRIVAIISVDDDASPVVLFKNVPDDAKYEINQMIEDVIYG